MNEELKKKLLKILEELPDENSCVEYKEIPYRDEKYTKAAFIKDICGFINSSEAYGKDKFIILGIRDKTKERIGVSTVPMEDDEKYQSWCDYIEPRPTIETGKIKLKNIEYGYIYITKDNNERIYSINKDYPDEYVMREEEIKKIKNKVYASVAYIRKGSKNYTLSEFDRRKIYEYDKGVKENRERLSYSIQDIANDDKDILKICALFGTWNENNEDDKKIISDTIGVEYKEWIKVLRKLLTQKSEYILFKNNIWKIENKEELIEKYSDDYFEEDIKKFEDATLKIITEVDPKFDLEADKRMMSNIMGQKTLYSKEMKKSALETFAHIKSICSKFTNCEKEVKKSQWYIVRNVLQDSNWKILATLNEILPILAEINESEYISQLNDIIKNKNDELTTLFNEKEEYITTTGYTYGLLWSLELISWNPIYIMQAFDIYGKLGKYDKNVIDSMSRILLPWYPQTKADINLRKATLEMLLRDYNDIGWKLLMQLMPNQQNHSFPTYKPKWNNIIDEEKLKVTNKELYEQYNEYIKLAINYSKSDKDKIIKLIDELDDVPEELFNLICNKITSEEVTNIKEEEKFYIWNELENLIAKHKAHADTEWALPKDAIKKLEEVSKEIKPVREEIYYKRLFNGNYWNLVDDNDSYEEQESKLLDKQKKAVNELLKSGIEKVIDFAKNTKDPYRVGIALATIELKDTDEKILLNLLNEDEFLISQGYVFRKFLVKKFEWLNSIDIDSICTKGRVRLLIQLPNNKLVWDKVKEFLEDEEESYWKEVNIYSIEDGNDYDYPLKKLLEYNRPGKALDLISMAIHQKRKFSKKVAADALEKAVEKQEDVNYIDEYHLKSIIKDLQDSNYDSSELFKIEWAYLPILDNNNEYRPITIERKLCKDPTVFMEVICLAFKARNDETNKENDDSKLAINAYRLLNLWRLVPGTNEKGIIDSTELNTWFDEMKKLAEEKDRLEVSLLHFGQVLYYSPESEDGFWIDKSVAEILNRDDADVIRRGYAVQAFNSVGVVHWDSEGKVWLNLEEKWNRRIESTDPKYFRIIKMLRDIAEDFHNQAQRMKDDYDF